MVKALTVFGTRPEVIKMFPVIKKLRDSGHEVRTVAMRQHEELLDQTLSVFGLDPDYTIDSTNDSKACRLNDVLTMGIRGIDRVVSIAFADFKPDVILVQGDTTTALGTALGAFNMQIPVAHIEAGLRTGHLDDPFPEEANRTIIDEVSSFHYCPTQRAASHIKATDHCLVTGNTELDSILWLARNKDISAPEGRYVVVTMHRRENQGDPFLHVREAVQDLALSYPKTTFYIFLHPNPEVQKVFASDLWQYPPNMRPISPLSYDEFISLISNAYFVLTDSGGVQEACSFLDIPVLVAREHTERMEGIIVGGAKLVGGDSEAIINIGEDLLSSRELRTKMSDTLCPYGDGFASEKIVADLEVSLANS